MTERTIGLADTSSFRYIGVHPPLDDALMAEIAGELILPDWIEHNHVYISQHPETDGPAYTEFSFDVGSGIDYLGVDAVDANTAGVAQQLARLLQARGDTAIIIEGVFPTDSQTPIFGERWNEMVEEDKFLKYRDNET